MRRLQKKGEQQMKIEIKGSSKGFRVWVDEGSARLGWIKDPKNIITTLSIYDAWVFEDENQFEELRIKLNKQLIYNKIMKECWYVAKE